MLVGADHGVALPVAALSAVIDACWALRDMSLTEEFAAGIGASASFSTELGGDPEVGPEVAAVASVKSEITVEGLNTHDGLVQGKQ